MFFNKYIVHGNDVMRLEVFKAMKDTPGKDSSFDEKLQFINNFIKDLNTYISLLRLAFYAPNEAEMKRNYNKLEKLYNSLTKIVSEIDNEAVPNNLDILAFLHSKLHGTSSNDLKTQKYNLISQLNRTRIHLQLSAFGYAAHILACIFLLAAEVAAFFLLVKLIALVSFSAILCVVTMIPGIVLLLAGLLAVLFFAVSGFTETKFKEKNNDELVSAIKELDKIPDDLIKSIQFQVQNLCSENRRNNFHQQAENDEPVLGTTLGYTP